MNFQALAHFLRALTEVAIENSQSCCIRRNERGLYVQARVLPSGNGAMVTWHSGNVAGDSITNLGPAGAMWNHYATVAGALDRFA